MPRLLLQESMANFWQLVPPSEAMTPEATSAFESDARPDTEESAAGNGADVGQPQERAAAAA